MMSTIAEAKRWLLLKRLMQLLLVAAFLALVLLLPRIGAVLDALTPPRLPALDTTSTPKRLEQNWPVEVSQRFHSITQGTRTLPLPFSWLLALEEPHQTLLAVTFLRAGRFMDDDYILRFGFIKGETNAHNPLGLPIGITATPGQNLPGINYVGDAVGFTCAACHTGHLTYDNEQYLVDGGPASTDLGQLTIALGAALGQTALSGKLPFFNGRFERFAKAVLGDAYSNQREVELQAELDALLANLAELPADVDVVEGFSRLDALNRIGNQVFAINNGRPENYVPIDAPVNYPHLWTSSWFDWVQYDGSIMGPLIRNSGEALGVNANVNTTAPHSEQRFASSVNVESLVWVEDALSGPAPYPDRSFQGLLAPRWPAEFPPIDANVAREGRTLYITHCEACHLPPVDSPDIWEHFSEVEYYQSDEPRSTPDRLLRVKTIALSQIGTDPARASVMVERTVNTAGDPGGTIETRTLGMGLDTTVCVVASEAYPRPPVGFPPPRDVESPAYMTERLVTVPVRDSETLLFALALGGLVQEVNKAWFAQNYISEALQAIYEKGRPNCLRAGAGYKARPLNGVWATAPFLHNGSVPSVYDMLIPPEERPEFVQLGSTEFDPATLGIVQTDELAAKIRRRPDERYIDGYFILDTKLDGNHNSGHEFSDRWDPVRPWYDQPKGVIGPQLSENDRLRLIEFLKTQ